MAEPKETGFFRGTGGAIWEMDLPLSPLMGEQLAKQDLVRVNEDGSTYTGPPTPVAGGMVLAVDPKDVEIERLKARLAELEAERAAEAEAAAEFEQRRVPDDLSTLDIRRPAQSAPKKDWVGYAVAQGMGVAEADGMTKEQLVERFGKPEQ